MPTEYLIDAAHHIVRSRAWGSLTDAESQEHYHQMAHDPAFDASFRQLCDLRSVTAIEASPHALRALAQASIFLPGTRRAFVAHVDEHFGLARMLQVFCELEGSEIGVFRTMAEAEAWLNSGPDLRRHSPDEQ